MISPEARNAIQIDRVCSAAICEEIGARLRIRLAGEHDRLLATPDYADGRHSDQRLR